MSLRRDPRVLTPRSIGLCLILGLITSLAVAAAMGWFLYRGTPTGYKTDLIGRPLSGHITREEFFGSSYYQEFEWLRGTEFEARSAVEIRNTFRAATWQNAVLQPFASSLGGPDANAFMVEWGWPFRCLWGTGESRWRTSERHRFGLYIYFRQLDPNTTYSRLIPFAPVFLGLTLDTLVWATPWWLGLFGIRRLRRHLRLRRNHCPHCNYDLCATPTDATCPECGSLRASPADRA